jgi:hypothetical protein
MILVFCAKYLQSVITDFKESGKRRHGARITPQAERPVPANPDLITDE